MANRTIITGVARAFYPHVDAPHAVRPDQPEKYSLGLAFPKSGQLPTHLGAQEDTSVTALLTALNEVCTEEWGVDFNNAPQVRQVQFPPRFKDGDQDWEKDDNGNLQIGTPRPASQGNWIINVKSDLPVGCVDHTGANEIDPKQIYAGCWVRCQVEVGAFVNKQSQSIIAVTLLNVQKCYDDESLGGGGARQSAAQAFGGMTVQNSNCQVGQGQQFTQAQGNPGQAPAAPQMPGQGQQPQQPQQPQHPQQPQQQQMPGNTGQQQMPGNTGQQQMPTGQEYLNPAQPGQPGQAPAAPQMPGQG